MSRGVSGHVHRCGPGERSGGGGAGDGSASQEERLLWRRGVAAGGEGSAELHAELPERAARAGAAQGGRAGGHGCDGPAAGD